MMIAYKFKIECNLQSVKENETKNLEKNMKKEKFNKKIMVIVPNSNVQRKIIIIMTKL